MIKREEKYYSDMVDRIKEVAYSIEPHKVTILTGQNGSGKSVIVALLSAIMGDKLGTKPDHSVSAISMRLRTGGSGVMRAFTSDTAWDPTGLNSYSFIISLFHSSKNKFMVLDEMEIGMSDELLVSSIDYINQNYNPDDYNGLLVITHSKDVVKMLKHDCFINISGLSEDEWLNREIKPMDVEQLEEDAHQLFLMIEKRKKK